MERFQKVAEKVLENSPIATGATTAAGTASGVLTAIQGWVGIGVAVGTFALNWWYKARKDKRDRERHEDSSSED